MIIWNPRRVSSSRCNQICLAPANTFTDRPISGGIKWRWPSPAVFISSVKKLLPNSGCFLSQACRYIMTDKACKMDIYLCELKQQVPHCALVSIEIISMALFDRWYSLIICFSPWGNYFPFWFVHHRCPEWVWCLHVLPPPFPFKKSCNASACQEAF